MRRLRIWCALGVLAWSLVMAIPGVAATGIAVQRFDLAGVVSLAVKQNQRLIAATLERDQAVLVAQQAEADAEVHPSQSALRRAVLGRESAELNLATVRLQVRRDAEKVYYQALSAAAQLGVARSNAANASDLAAATRAKVNEGVSAELDALNADQAAAAASRAIENAAEALQLAEANLRSTLGLAPGEELALTSGELAFQPCTITEAELVSGGMKSSVEVARAEQELAAASADAESAVVGGGAPLNQRLAAIAEEQARIALGQVRDSVTLQAKQLYYALNRTRRQFDTAAAGVTLNEANQTAARVRYEEGLITAADLTKSNLDLANARIAADQALLDYHLARLEALNFAGGPEQEVAR